MKTSQSFQSYYYKSLAIQVRVKTMLIIFRGAWNFGMEETSNHFWMKEDIYRNTFTVAPDKMMKQSQGPSKI